MKLKFNIKLSSQFFGTFFNYLKSNWWWLILLMVVIGCTIIFFTPYTEKLVQWAKVLTDVLTPFSILLGVILGYPLLKKKLTEQYVMKQFEIRDVANREVRHKVIELLDKYPVKYISNRLTLDYIKEALNRITELRNIALDAQPDVYRYINLIYKTLINLDEIYSHYDKDAPPHYNYEEILARWLHNQLQEVYDYSKSIGVLPSGEAIVKPKLNKTLSPFVTNNSVTEIRDLVHTIEYLHNEAMLVLFFGTSNNSLSGDNVEIYKAAYEAAPSPCPFARLLLNNSIYFPIFLKSKDKLWIEYGELMLIGYRKKKSANLNGDTNSYYECIYANISNIDFVNNTIKKREDLSEFFDGYLECNANLEGFYDFRNLGHEIIRINISHHDAQENFSKVKEILFETIKKEL
ncbi:MAG: hypothetical protein NC453_29880 [Muribaculum sp.]|nr:hypothetical protein [Muribaculum sp.]